MKIQSIPTDPLGAAIWGLNLGIDLLGVNDAYNALKTGIAAKAQAEGRNVTPEEEAALDVILEASKRARDGV